MSVMTEEVTVIMRMMSVVMYVLIVTAAWQSETIPLVGIKYTQILFMYIYMIKMKNNSL